MIYLGVVSLTLNYLRFDELPVSIGLCLSPNLGSFQIPFHEIFFFYPNLFLSFWDSDAHMHIWSFDVILQVPESLSNIFQTLFLLG